MSRQIFAECATSEYSAKIYSVMEPLRLAMRDTWHVNMPSAIFCWVFPGLDAKCFFFAEFFHEELGRNFSLPTCFHFSECFPPAHGINRLLPSAPRLGTRHRHFMSVASRFPVVMHSWDYDSNKETTKYSSQCIVGIMILIKKRQSEAYIDLLSTNNHSNDNEIW